jgi:hypothetical protein
MTLRGLLAVSLLALAACATPVQTRYYTLSGGAPPPAQAAPAYRVAIGPVTVPEALDRMQIVLRVAPNQYAISDGERWSEPLKRGIPRVIAEQLGQRLPAARIAVHLQYAAQDADYRVLIDVLRFESVPGEGVTLEAAWTVRSRAGAASGLWSGRIGRPCSRLRATSPRPWQRRPKRSASPVTAYAKVLSDKNKVFHIRVAKRVWSWRDISIMVCCSSRSQYLPSHGRYAGRGQASSSSFPISPNSRPGPSFSQPPDSMRPRRAYEGDDSIGEISC